MSYKNMTMCQHGIRPIEYLQLPHKLSTPSKFSSLLGRHGIEITDLGERDPEWFEHASAKARLKKDVTKLLPCSTKPSFKTPTNPSLSEEIFTQDGLFSPVGDMKRSTAPAQEKSYTGLFQDDSNNELGSLWSPIKKNEQLFSHAVQFTPGVEPIVMSTPYRMSTSLGAKLDDSEMVWSSSLATPLADTSVCTGDASMVYFEKSSRVHGDIAGGSKSSVRMALTYNSPFSKTTDKEKEQTRECHEQTKHQPLPAESVMQDDCLKNNDVRVLRNPVSSEDCGNVCKVTKETVSDHQDDPGISDVFDSSRNTSFERYFSFVQDVVNDGTSFSVSQLKPKQVYNAQSNNFGDADGTIVSGLATSLDFLFMTPPANSDFEQCRRKRRCSSTKKRRESHDDEDLLSALIQGNINVPLSDNTTDVSSSSITAKFCPHSLRTKIRKTSSLKERSACDNIAPKTVETDFRTNENLDIFDEEEVIIRSSCSVGKRHLGPKEKLGPAFSTPKIEGAKFKFMPHPIGVQTINENIALTQEFFATVPLSTLHAVCQASEDALEISAVEVEDRDMSKLEVPAVQYSVVTNIKSEEAETNCPNKQILPDQKIENASGCAYATDIKTHSEIKPTTLQTVEALQVSEKVTKPIMANPCRRFIYPTPQQIMQEYPEQVLNLNTMPSNMTEIEITTPANALSVWDDENVKLCHSSVDLFESKSKSHNLQAHSGLGQFLSFSSYSVRQPSEKHTQSVNKGINAETCCPLASKSIPITDNSYKKPMLPNAEEVKLPENVALQINEAVLEIKANNDKRLVGAQCDLAIQSGCSFHVDEDKCGFKFASGKDVCLSRSALEAAQELWESTTTMNTSFSSSQADVSNEKKRTDLPSLQANLHCRTCVGNCADLYLARVSGVAEKSLPELISTTVKNLPPIAPSDQERTGGDSCHQLTTPSKQKKADDTYDLLPFGDVSITEVIEVAESTYACLQAMELDEVAVVISQNSTCAQLGDFVNKTQAENSDDTILMQPALQQNTSCVNKQYVSMIRESSRPATVAFIDQDVSVVLENILAYCCNNDTIQDELAATGFPKEDLLALCCNSNEFCNSQWKPESDVAVKDEPLTLEIKYLCDPKTKTLVETDTSAVYQIVPLPENEFSCQQISGRIDPLVITENMVLDEVHGGSVELLSKPLPQREGWKFNRCGSANQSVVVQKNCEPASSSRNASRFSTCRDTNLKLSTVVDAENDDEKHVKKRTRQIYTETETKISVEDKQFSSTMIVSGSKRARLNVLQDDENEKYLESEKVEASSKNLLSDLCDTVAARHNFLDEIDCTNTFPFEGCKNKGTLLSDRKEYSIPEQSNECLHKDISDTPDKTKIYTDGVTNSEKLLVGEEHYVDEVANYDFENSFSVDADIVQQAATTANGHTEANSVGTFDFKIVHTDKRSDDESRTTVSAKSPTNCNLLSEDVETLFVATNESHSTFPGFSTAGGKIVSVSYSALQHAKKVYSETTDNIVSSNAIKVCGYSDEKEISMTHLEMSDRSEMQYKDSFPDTRCVSAMQRTKLISDKNSVINKPLYSFDSCDTTGGKAIDVVDKDLRILDEKVAINNEEVHPNFSEFVTTGDRTNAISLVVLNEGQKILEEANEKVRITNSSTDWSRIVGATVKQNLGACKVNFKEAWCNLDQLAEFCAVRGRPVVVSNEALEKAHLFPVSNEPACMKKTQQNVGEMKNEGTNVAVNQMPEKSFCGFSTAGGKTIQVSDDALKKAKQFFDDHAEVHVLIEGVHPIQSENLDVGVHHPGATSIHQKQQNSFCGFSTAGGKTIQVSDDVLKKAKQVFDDSAEVHVLSEKLDVGVHHPGSENNNQKQQNSFCGFSTAGGKTIQVSDDALKKAKQFFDDSAEVHVLSEKLDVGVHHPGSENINQKQQNSFCGFSTAGGKTIQVSDDVLKKAKQLFDDSAEVHVLSENLDVGVHHPGSENNNQKQQTSFCGFSTAGGKAIQVSDDALKKAKQFFDDNTEVHVLSEKLDVDAHHPGATNIHQKQQNSFCGFSTAGGKTIQVSDDALQKAKQLFDDSAAIHVPPDDLIVSAHHARATNINQKQQNLFCGFSTAGGSTIQVSNDALKQAKKLFNDSSEGNDLKQKCDAASCLPDSPHNLIKLKADLRYCKQVLAEDHKNRRMEQAVGLKQFFRQEVCILDKTWERSQEVVTEFVKDLGNPCQKEELGGFSTAAGKAVVVSEDALKKSRKVFLELSGVEEQLEGLCNFSTNNVIQEEVKHAMSSFQDNNLMHHKSFAFDGFSTAAGKTIQISDDVLEKAKRILDETENFYLPQKGCNSAPFSDTKVQETQSANRTIKRHNEMQHKDCITETCSLVEVQTKLGQKLKVSELPCDSFVHEITDTEIDESMAAFLADEADQSSMSPNHCKSLGYETYDGNTKKDCSRSNNNSSLSTLKLTGRSYDHLNQTLRRARQNQEVVIKSKVKSSVTPVDGKYWTLKHNSARGNRTSLKNGVGGRFPESYSRDELVFLGVLENVLNTSSSTAEDFKFDVTELLCSSDNISEIMVGDLTLIPNECGFLGKKEFYNALLASPGVEPKLIDASWAHNHYKWIVWKLAAMEVAFPQQFAGKCLTMDQVAYQVKFRYNKEIDYSQRSAIKRILERDDSASKTVILCVASIISVEKSSHIEGDSKNVIPVVDTLLEVTDGWYSMRALLDEPLKNYVAKRKIVVGQKLIIHSAELVGSTEACSPLEIPSNLFLKLAANSTRRAHWSVKLGFYKYPQPFPVLLSSVLGNGGIVSCTEAVVVRVYSMQFMERFQDTCIFRNAKAEAKAAAQYEEQCRILKEKLYIEIAEQLENEESKKAKKSKLVKLETKIENLKSGEDVHRLFDFCDDPANLADLLTASQKNTFSEYWNSLLEKRQVCLLEEFQKRLLQNQDDGKFPQDRVVIPFIRVLLAGVSSQGYTQNKFGSLTIWKPTSDFDQVLKEGQAFRIFYVLASNYNRKNAGVQLATTRRTKYEAMTVDSSTLESVYFPREVCGFDDLRRPDFTPPYSEVDAVGIVASVSSSKVSSGICQMVYLVDVNMDVLGIKVWIDKYSTEESLQLGDVIAACNLQVRRHELVNGCIPLVHTSETSMFTKHPKRKYLQEPFDKLKNIIKKDCKFVATAVDRVTDLLCRKDGQLSTNAFHLSVKTESRLCVSSVNFSNTECVETYSNHQILKSVQQKQNHNELLSWTDTLCEGEGIVLNSAIPPTVQNHQIQAKFSWLQRVGLSPPLSPLAAPIPYGLRKNFKSPFRTDNKPSCHTGLDKPTSTNLTDSERDISYPKVSAGRKEPFSTDSPPMDLC